MGDDSPPIEPQVAVDRHRVLDTPNEISHKGLQQAIDHPAGVAHPTTLANLCDESATLHSCEHNSISRLSDFFFVVHRDRLSSLYL